MNCCIRFGRFQWAICKMSLSSIAPPISVLGMKTLNREKFKTEVNVPCLHLPVQCSEGMQRGVVIRLLKKYIFKVRKARSLEYGNEELRSGILLDPEVYSGWTCLDESDRIKLEQQGIDEKCVSSCRVPLSYDNFDAGAVLRGVIGDSAPNVAGFSKVGHIVHLNLRPEHEPYKEIVGQVLMDKIPGTRTVINKTTNIETEFRNLSYEVLAGEDDMIATVKENGCVFHLDYGKVYWNPRLGTEHENLAQELEPSTILYDLFAGVGPFAVPAGKRKIQVLANDLNPDSVLWLKKNIEVNKVSKYVTPYNMDARDLVRTVVRNDMMARYKDNPDADLRFAMNLPALAEIFLDEFDGLLNGILPTDLCDTFRLPVVYLYCFQKEGDKPVMDRVRTYLRYPLDDDVVTKTFVRLVAPKKEMLRLRFQVPRALLLREKQSSSASSLLGGETETERPSEEIERIERCSKRQRL